MAKISIFSHLLGLSLLFALTTSTSLTYIVEKEIDQADTFVELTAKVQVDGTSLQRSIQTAEQLINQIKSIVTQDCQTHAKGKSEAKKCKDMVQDSKFEVEPKYHLVRKIPTFTLFILTHELTISVKHTKTLGRLIDKIVSAGGQLITLQELTWQTQDQIDPEVSTLKDGLAEGKQLCKKMGKVLEQVISVEELEEPQEEQEGEEDEMDPDLTAPEIESVIFKFKVKCGDKKKTK